MKHPVVIFLIRNFGCIVILCLGYKRNAFSNIWVIVLWSVLTCTPFFFFFFSAIVLNNENSSIHIDAVIDPLSPSGQKLSSILRVLWKYIQPSMRIVLNPLVRHSFPLVYVSTLYAFVFVLQSATSVFFLSTFFIAV